MKENEKEKSNEIDRKTQILSAALNCFVSKGYYETTMDDIVKESKLSKGAIYWYFKSKEQILEEVMVFWFNLFVQQFEALLAEVTDYRRALTDLGKIIFDEVLEEKEMRWMFFEYMGHASRKKELQEIISDYYSKWMDMFEDFMRQGVKNGQLKVKNVRTAIEHISSIIEGSLLIWMINPDLIDPKKVWQMEIQCILHNS